MLKIFILLEKHTNTVRPRYNDFGYSDKLYLAIGSRANDYFDEANR
jgi:hypothetical protein